MILVLLCLVVVPAHAAYGDYGGAKMPHYGESFDDSGKDNDYKDAALLDSPSLLDNKFDDEPFGKHDDRINYHDETMNEEKARFKIKRPYTEANYKLERYNPDKPLKHNSKSRKQYPRIEDDDLYDIEADRNRKVNYRSQTDQGFDDDYSEIRHTDETSQRFVKRKARDRVMTTERGDSDFKSYTMHSNGKRLSKPSKHKNKMRTKYVDDEIYSPTDRKPTRRKVEREYTDYQDNYDMIKVENIKNKLPQLLRRTQEDIATTTEFVETRPVLILAQQKYLESTKRNPFGINKADYFTPTTLKIATTEQTTGKTTEETVETTATTETEQTTFEESTTLKELSIAEKSRLSIMRKAQKKEFAKVEETKKPPVLMKVTQNDMNTVVMIEPPDRPLPDVPGYANIQRAIEVTNDSPEMLLKVKKLMRQKLVKGARSINDIIDNWNETVCDYIDMSLLTSSSCSLSLSSWWSICYVILNYQLITYLMLV